MANTQSGLILPKQYLENLGPLRPLIEDDSITEIMAVGHERIYVERDGQIELSELSFDSEDQLLEAIHCIVEAVGRMADENHPLIDARLIDGSRVNVVLRPIAVDGPLLTIRKFSKRALTPDDLLRLGAFTQECLAVMKAAVLARSNIIVSGGTGSGKTTLLNVLSGFVPSNERIVTIEDAAELKLMQEHVCRMETKPATEPGERDITIRDLVINALRMRPDRIIVGECRGKEALDMLQAMNTGHDGSMTTVHANSPRDVLSRLETMVLMAGIDLPLRAIRQQISSAIDLIIHVARLRDGSRRVTHLSEIVGMEGDTITMQDIFVFEPKGLDNSGAIKGEFRPTGIRPRLLDRLAAQGLAIPEGINKLFPSFSSYGLR
jgi:pilus assembly protein CpaF